MRSIAAVCVMLAFALTSLYQAELIDTTAVASQHCLVEGVQNMDQQDKSSNHVSGHQKQDQEAINCCSMAHCASALIPTVPTSGEPVHFSAFYSEIQKLLTAIDGDPIKRPPRFS